MAKPIKDLRSLARSYTEVAVQTLAGISKNGKNENARVSASGILLDRGWGKAVQPIEGTGEDGQIIVQIIQKVREKK